MGVCGAKKVSRYLYPPYRGAANGGVGRCKHHAEGRLSVSFALIPNALLHARLPCRVVVYLSAWCGGQQR